MYLFISHSSKDADTAQELCRILEANNHTCFLASRDIRPGQEYAAELIDALDRSDAVLLLLSGHAVASPHVLREIERAVSKSVPILVYKLEEVTLPKSFEYFLMPHQWLDADFCRYDALLNCLTDLEQEAGSKRGLLHTDASTTAVSANKRKSSRKLFALLLGIAVILVLGVSLGFALSGSSEKKDTKVSENVEEEDKLDNNTSDDTTNSGTTDTTNSNGSSAINSAVGNTANVQPGDSITLGTYNDAPVEWKVLSVSDDGTEALLISKYILTFKAFDGADSGSYDFSGTSADGLGSNAWETSAIRTWLNSAKDYVSYNGAAPTDRSMSDGCNGYDLEAGFLYDFSKEELAAIKETTLETGGVSTTDRVFLLSLADLELFAPADVSLFAVPTAEAIERNESTFYTDYCRGVFRTDASAWWLRDAAEDSATQGVLVSHGAKDYTTETSTVCADGYGIRPAIVVDLSKLPENP